MENKDRSEWDMKEKIMDISSATVIVEYAQKGNEKWVISKAVVFVYFAIRQGDAKRKKSS